MTMKLSKEMQRGAANVLCAAEKCGVVFALDGDKLVRIGKRTMPENLESFFSDYSEQIRWALIAVRQKVATKLAMIVRDEREARHLLSSGD
jgi:hypothetical protein